MKKWKAALAGFLILCLSLISPSMFLMAEEPSEEENWQEESVDIPIESNDIKDWPEGPQIEAASAIVMDLDSSAILYSKNAKTTQYPASITKIMTTLLLIENCDLDEEITFSEIVYDLEEGSSHLGIQAGEKMKLEDAAYGLMLASANDISNGVAEYISGGLSAFADLMNARASELGCVNTHFSNPHGLFSKDHYTCAYDMALIAQEAYRNPLFRKIAGTKEYTIPETNLSGEDRSFLNHHKMLNKDEEFYRDYVTGGKTGFTSDSLNTLVTFAQKDGRRLVSVVLRVNGADKAYRDSAQILEYGFDNFYEACGKEISSNKSFYELSGLNRLGFASNYQADAWKKMVGDHCEAYVTLPRTVSGEKIQHVVEKESDGITRVSYEYEGNKLGYSTGHFNKIFVPVIMPYHNNAKSAYVAEEGETEWKSQTDDVENVMEQVSGIFETWYRQGMDYVEQNPIIVLIVGGVALLLLLCFILLIVFRCTANSRIRRRRRAEEEERKAREEEIENMTTAQIEAELRDAMEQERIRREKEEREAAEAERAALEAQRLDDEAHETERLIEELEKERQERLKKEE